MQSMHVDSMVAYECEGAEVSALLVVSIIVQQIMLTIL